MLRKPPDILITTPESLFLLLTSQGREMLKSVRTLILDEVHAVAGTKRGAHLALSVERLDRLVGEPVQRVGLSATQRPIEEIGRFVSGARPIRIVDAGTRKELDLQVVVPVEDMREPGAGAGRPIRCSARAAEGTPSTSIWPSIYPELLRLVEEHRSTIVFVNNRRLAERLALRLNELAEEEIARAHHGSLAREQRRRGRGAAQARPDPVPRRDLVARARDRHGRGRPRHPGRVAEVGRARPAAHRPRRPRARRGVEGPDLPEVPRRPARVGRRRRADARRRDRGDGDPAQPARRARAADRRRSAPRRRSRSGSCTTSSAAPIRSPTSRAASSRTCSTCSRAATRPTSSRSSSRASSGTGRAARSAGATARAGSRSRTRARSPTAASSACTWSNGGGRVGELDEEMVYEARAGQTFLLGASTWRIEEITRDRVIVSPAPGVPGAVPFWKGEGVGRPYELGEQIGRASRELGSLSRAKAIERLHERHMLDDRAAAEPRSRSSRSSRRRPARSRPTARRRRAVPRRDRRLARLHPHAVRRARARAVGDGGRRAAARLARARRTVDLVGRRDRLPPARRRRAAAHRGSDARPRRARGAGRRRGGADGALRLAVPRERRRGRC